MYNYWFDIKEYYEEMNIMDIDRYFLFYLYFLQKDSKEPIKIPSLRFWCYTILCIECGMKIYMKDGCLLSIKDCFIELEDLWKSYGDRK